LYCTELVSMSSAPVAPGVEVATPSAWLVNGRAPLPGASPALAEVAELLAQNKLVIKVQTFPFGRAAEAYRISQGGHVRGKLVLIP
jgi:Zinc-binding dehydrogenase